MSFPTAFLLIVAGLIVSAHARLNAVLLGQPVSIPWLAVAAAVVILVLIVGALLLIRAITREGFRSSPYPRERYAI